MNNSSGHSAVAYKTHPEFIASEQIWIYVSPILIFVGTIANTLSIIVLLRKRMRTSTTMFYLTVLSFGDMMVLYTGLLRYWIKSAFHEDIRLISEFSCKIHAFLVYFSLDFTTWVLVAVTIDRCIFVCLPFRAKRLCTLKHAKIVVIGIALVMTALNFQLFWGVSFEVQLGELACTHVNDFTEFAWPWIDFCMFSIVPFTIMIIANILIIKKLFMSHKRVASHNHEAAHSEHSESVMNHSNGHSVNVHAKQRKVPSVTTMLLTTNCVFLALTLPIVVYLIVYPYVLYDATDHVTAVLQLLWAIANMFQYTNNTIHFFLYCMTGPRFRRELFKLFNIKTRSSHELTMTMEMH
ncbi:FMRFamide receptor-like [Saccostrea echinata]|uniref:FMRFamide receptor-like n=1 Tax=Saccostrea echinata TaxID=191078 RepID=UPI002A81FAEF|nr:FMRFamide receptor-like [Saccostrea echinata]